MNHSCDSNAPSRRISSGDAIRILYMVDYRYRLTVCCLKAKGPFLEPLKKAGIPIVEFSPGGTLLSVRGLFQLLQLARFIHKNKFHIVHTHDLWSDLMGVPAAWLGGVPMIISSRRDMAHLDWYTARRRKVIGLIHRLSQRVMVNCSAVRELIAAEDVIDLGKIRIIRNGVDFERFAFSEGNRENLFPGVGKHRTLIAVVANMHSTVKGHPLLIDAARTICRTFPEVVFVLIGDGEMRAKFEERVKSLDLALNFFFLGQRNDVPEVLKCCDLFVLPSKAEGLPNAVLEAMAACLPVVATRVGGVSEIIENGVTGLLVEPESADSLISAICRLLGDRALQRRLAVAGQENARCLFSFDRVLQDLEQLYRA